ncbi:hypothetical protein PR202_ga01579 [Eleusine coracana subsp. coracana]|uniref:Uncharacterized protein n=1 Tax=Eleusine coracana subsp. coracana TaxID=191504 RepID=A0AAV5BFD4_ELECO|nr:hypothetical protein PR202_ga00892 [Eleusine coracana subsp. coracana]GJM85781.1 hypothetical protein PR202_ga01579 [Eleusine coracana subsp. coracana]
MPVSRGGKPASSSKPNPFDSDSDSEDFTSKKSSTAYKAPADAKKRYKDGFRDSGGLENQSVQELENYAAYKAEETTDALSGCLRIAEDIKQDASNTLITLHKQGGADQPHAREGRRDRPGPHQGRDASGEPWRVLLQAMEAQKDEEDQGTCHGVTR